MPANLYRVTTLTGRRSKRKFYRVDYLSFVTKMWVPLLTDPIICDTAKEAQQICNNHQALADELGRNNV
jgi:hypothetical protein